MKTENEWFEELKDKLIDLGFEPLTEVLKTTNADLGDLRSGTAYLETEIDGYISSNHSEPSSYAEAMALLAEHDPSLRKTMRVASELGYAHSEINSKCLGSLLSLRLTEEAWSHRFRHEANYIIENFFLEYDAVNND